MVVHIAGCSMQVGSKIRQLCAWCGHPLIDMDLEDVMVAPKEDGSPGDGPGFWAQGHLIEVDGPCSRAIPDPGDVLPVECCASQRRLLALVK